MPRRLRSALVLLVAMLLMVTSLSLSSQGRPPVRRADYSLVLLRGPADHALLRGMGLEPAVDYGSFLLLQVPPRAQAALAAKGLQVLRGERLTHLLLGPYSFDPLEGSPRLPPGLTLPENPPSRATYIVQFIGPVRAEWVEGLKASGAALGDYLPNDAFVARMDPAARDAVASKAEVRWVGLYQPAYRLSQNLAGVRGSAEVNVLLFRDQEGEALGALARTLGRAGAPVHLIAAFGPYDLVRALVPVGALPDLARLDATYWVEGYVPPRLDEQYVPPILQSATAGLVFNTSFGNVPVWFHGITGSGEVVGLSDTGIDYDHQAFRQGPTTVGTPGPSHRKIYAYHIMPGGDDHDNDVSGHGTHVANILAGDAASIGGTNPNLQGNAPRARISFDDLAGPSDSLTGVPADLYNLFRQNYLDGARVASNSWGAGPPAGAPPFTGGFYSSDAWSADNFTWTYKDILLVYAAGNSGYNLGTTSSPGTAKDTLAVGATYDYTAMDLVAPFSARGPTQDGRIKPEVMAPGLGYTFPQYPNILSADSDGSLTTLNNGVIGLSGTSMATPAVAGTAVLVHQYYRDGYYPTGAANRADGFSPSAALVKATLINSAREMSSTGATTNSAHLHPWTNVTPTYYPNNDQGFGRIKLDDALFFAGDARRLAVIDNTAALVTGQAMDYEVTLSTPAMFKVTLAWTDAPGSLAGGRELVNDLDLEVTQEATGNLYRGNIYSPGSVNTPASDGSIPNPSVGPDTLNNVEQVQINTPAVGTYRLRVRASNVPVGPQPFALVVTGGLSATAGILSLDRASYGEASTVGIRLEDADATAPQVTIASGYEAAGETVNLAPLGAGVWTAQVPTTLDPPAPDGRISVRSGDTIAVAYREGAVTTKRTALVDLVLPTIGAATGGISTSREATFTFTTSKPTSTTIAWGATASLEKPPIQDAALRLVHRVTLPNLDPNTTYLFDVAVQDQAGHALQDDNGGRHYAVTTAPEGDILLVDGSHGSVEAVDVYQRDLAARGWTSSRWDVASRGDPPLVTLQAHRSVVWEIGDYYPPLSTNELALVKAYLDGGGRLLVASHDVAFAFGNPKSGFSSPATATWLASVLKATWSADVDFTTLYGAVGDPISGAYTGGVPYAPFRPGAGGDEVSPVAAGGSTLPVWYDSTTRNALPVGLRWTSNSNNGTAGQGVWGGTRSRLLAYFFEPFQINPGNPAGPQRVDIMDRGFTWLLERDHPDATLVAPRGGEVITASPYPISWSVTAQGTPTVGIYYSTDGGSSWRFLAAVTGTTTYNWDLTGVPNGASLRVRLVVRDGATPSLQTVVDGAPFTVRMPGHDTQGPLVRPGSASILPDAVIAGSNAAFNATVDDSSTSGSNISAAELLFDVAGPSGTGIPMAPVPGSSFNAQLAMGVTWQGTMLLSVGNHRGYVHARDQAGNWGPLWPLAFQVNLARSLRDFPDPILVNGTFRATVIIGNSQPHLGLAASSTIDVVGAMPLASTLGLRSSGGYLPARLDYEVLTVDGTGVALPGNLVTIGGRGVNAVTRIYNQTLPAHIETNRGICAVTTGNCYRRSLNATTGVLMDYAYISLTWSNGRYVLGIAGLSGYATRAATQLMAQGAVPLSGVAVILRLDDVNNDGTYEAFAVQEVVQGVADGTSRPLPPPPRVRQTFVVGLSQPHGVTGGGASTIDVVGGVSLASLLARTQGQPSWAVLDIDVAHVTPDGKGVVVDPTGNLTALGGRGVNMVSWAFNASLPIRFENLKGICVVATGDCYRRSLNTTTGVLTDYAMDTFYFDAKGSRIIEVIAGLSGFASRGAMVALAGQVVTRAGSGIVIQLQDTNGDGNYEFIAVVETAP